MKVVVGAPVVLRVEGDIADASLLHVPAPAVGHGRGRRELRLLRWMPLEWRALCGLKGWVFTYDGPLRDAAKFCPVCVARSSGDLKLRAA